MVRARLADGRTVELAHVKTPEQVIRRMEEYREEVETAAGGETYLWRPSDLDEIAIILGRRWEPAHRDGAHRRVTDLWTDTEGHWQPGSLWVPGLGRADTTEQLQLLTTKGTV